MAEDIDLTPILGSRFKRFIAYLIDVIPIAVIVMLVFYYNFGLKEIFDQLILDPENEDLMTVFIEQQSVIGRIEFSIWIFYCAVMEASSLQGTLGKHLMKIKVVDQDGERLTVPRSAIRNISKLISMAIFSLGFIWILVDRRKQGWHDKFARSFVVIKE